VHDLVSLVTEGGHVLVLFFDSDTPEQRLVTRVWEKIAPFPEGGRGYTRLLLLDELRAAEDHGDGWLTHTRTGGVALASSKDAAKAWFNHLHFKNMPALVGDPEIQAEVAAFVDDFQVTCDPRHHRPPSP